MRLPAAILIYYHPAFVRGVFCRRVAVWQWERLCDIGFYIHRLCPAVCSDGKGLVRQGGAPPADAPGNSLGSRPPAGLRSQLGQRCTGGEGRLPSGPDSGLYALLHAGRLQSLRDLPVRRHPSQCVQEQQRGQVLTDRAGCGILDGKEKTKG